jgi:hypothetical protein
VVGALLSVPTVAFFNNAFKVLLAKDPVEESEELDDDSSMLQAEPDELTSKSG